MTDTLIRSGAAGEPASDTPAGAGRGTAEGAAPGDGGSTMRRLAREHATAAGAQLAAGAGNLAFVGVAARMLDAPAFAELVTFMALYLMAHLPGAAIAAAGAVGGVARQARLERSLGAVTAIAAWLLADEVGRLLGVDARLVVLLGLALAVGPTVAGERGRRFAAGDVRGVGASLLAEPATRLALGLPLVWAAGGMGGAAAVVAGGWAAAAVLARRGRLGAHLTADDGRASGRAAATAAAFVLLAVVQNLDLVLANRVLPSAEAARFAVVSTLGGLVIFATATVPMVLLPRARRGERGVLGAGLAAAAALGLGASLVAAVAPPQLFTAVFGARHGDVAHLAPTYLLAMAALGTGRVLAADRCARHGRRATVAAIALAAAVQGVLVWRAGDALGVVQATLAASAVLLAGLAVVPLARPVPRLSRRLVDAGAAALRRPDVPAVLGLTTAALVLRLAVDRGLWVDEAISVELAGRPLGAMLRQIRDFDVHPPLHSLILWATVRVAGSSELAVRLPSIIAGTALVPTLWLAGRSLYDRRTALVAAALGAVSPLLVWYSQEARMYAFFMLFAVLAVWAQVEAVRGGRAVHWFVYAASTAAMLWTQYFAVLVVVVQQVGFAAAVVITWRRDRSRAAGIARGWALSALAVGAAVTPLVPVASDQLAAYSTRRTATVPSAAGAGATSVGDYLSVYAVLANVTWALVGFHADRTMAQIVAMWPLAMMLTLVVLGRRRSGATTLLVAIAIVPAAVLFALGLRKRDLFELRYFAAAAPVAVLLAARLLALLARGRWALRAATAIAVAVLTVGLVDQQLNGANPRLYDFRGAIAEIRERAAPGDTVLYAPSYLATVVDYYGDDLRAQPLGSAPPAGRGVFVLATFRTMAERDTAAAVGTELAELERDHRLVDRFDRANVRVWELR